MRILHTEASNGWGGQEIRILREAEGMRQRGHTVVFAVTTGAQLGVKAREQGFQVYEFPLMMKHAFTAVYRLISIILREKIEIINTHSSADAWLGGIAARLTGRKVIRTRHLSTPSRPGWNSRVLFNKLADATVTTCEKVAEILRKQAELTPERCLSIPTGVDISAVKLEAGDREKFRKQWGFAEGDCVVGTVCVLRSWKGIEDFLAAAKILKEQKQIKWVIVGSAGPNEPDFRDLWEKWGLQDSVFFTGYMNKPHLALAGMDIFALLSTAHEGVSQASLLAAYLQKPLVTTTTGGLPEVCLDGKTGYLVPIKAPQEVADKVLALSKDPALRKEMGQRAESLVREKFTLKHTLDGMERVYGYVMKKDKGP